MCLEVSFAMCELLVESLDHRLLLLEMLGLLFDKSSNLGVDELRRGHDHGS